MPNLAGPHLLVLVAIIVLLFGASQLPKLARGLGQSVRILKTETRAMKEDAEDDDTVTPLKQNEVL